jgi:ubiquinone/menaquinone biosynthesis C-methylase UbiE
MEKKRNSETEFKVEDQKDLLEEYYGLKKGTFEFTDKDAKDFASRIELDIDLEQHKSLLVKKTASMITDISGKSVLDVGTGEGRWARYMASKRSANVIGIDKCSKMINIARERAKSDSPIDFYQGDIDTLDKNDFDFANAFFVLNYIQDLDKFFYQITRHLSDEVDYCSQLKL